MVGWCGEQFCDQVLLCRPLCCQKTLHYTPKSVQLKTLQNFIYSSGPIFLHSNQNLDHFTNPLIKGFQDINLKISHSLKIGAFIACLSNIHVSGQKHRNNISMNKTVFWLFLCNCPPFLGLLHTYRTQIGARRQWNQFEVFSLNAGIQFLGKAQYVKIICLQLKGIPAQIIQWNGDFRFFHNGRVCDKLWKNLIYPFHWISLAGIPFNGF